MNALSKGIKKLKEALADMMHANSALTDANEKLQEPLIARVSADAGACFTRSESNSATANNACIPILEVCFDSEQSHLQPG